jgi:SNF2-related domain
MVRRLSQTLDPGTGRRPRHESGETNTCPLWNGRGFDEAQQIKNHAAEAARLAKQLPALMRVALTGTPVENRLSELWSIVDLTNPGLLGPFARFKDRYAVPVERWRDADATARPRRIGVVLRRLGPAPGFEHPAELHDAVGRAAVHAWSIAGDSEDDPLLAAVRDPGSAAMAGLAAAAGKPAPEVRLALRPLLETGLVYRTGHAKTTRYHA